MSKWTATHRLSDTFGGAEFEYDVMLCGDGRAYTEDEWDASDNGDFCVSDGVWLFQGQPFTGTVEAL